MLTVEQVKQQLPVVMHPDARIQAALSEAYRIINETHGPEYQEDKLFRAEWDYNLNYPVQLYLGRNARRIISVTIGDDELPLDDIRFIPPSIVERIFSYWYGNLAINYQGVDDTATRNQMALDLIGKRLNLEGYKDLSERDILSALPRLVISGPVVPNRLTLVDFTGSIDDDTVVVDVQSVASWARTGSTEDVPDDKISDNIARVSQLGQGGGLNNQQVDARIATWARANSPSGTIPDSAIPASITRDSDLPAEADSADAQSTDSVVKLWSPEHIAEAVNAHETYTTSGDVRDALTDLSGNDRLPFSAIRGTVPDNQIPGTIARDSEIRTDNEITVIAHASTAAHNALADAHNDRLLPTGGTTGQVLKKDTNSNYDVSWQDDATGGGGGGLNNQQVDARIATWARANSPSGTIPAARIPSISSSKITSLDSAKLTGTIDNARIPASIARDNEIASYARATSPTGTIAVAQIPEAIARTADIPHLVEPDLVTALPYNPDTGHTVRINGVESYRRTVTMTVVQTGPGNKSGTLSSPLAVPGVTGLTLTRFEFYDSTYSGALSSLRNNRVFAVFSVVNNNISLTANVDGTDHALTNTYLDASSQHEHEFPTLNPGDFTVGNTYRLQITNASGQTPANGMIGITGEITTVTYAGQDVWNYTQGAPLDTDGRIPIAFLPIVQLTQTQYDALVAASNTDADTIYVIVN